MRIIQIIIMIIGLLGMIWFLLPFISYGIINIGNRTGTIVSLLITVYGIKMSDINNWIIQKWNTMTGKIVISLVGISIVIIIILVLVFSVFMIKSTKQKPNGNPTVIVLGCRVYGERPSLMLMERLNAAYKYLIENDDAICILSGGQGDGESISEAECMYRYLTEKGISSERLYQEDKSTSTRENLDFSKEIIDEHKLNNEVAIVTNEFHGYRARKIADSLEINSAAIPAKTAWWLFPTYYVRELYGILYEVLFYQR